MSQCKAIHTKKYNITENNVPKEYTKKKIILFRSPIRHYNGICLWLGAITIIHKK